MRIVKQLRLKVNLALFSMYYFFKSVVSQVNVVYFKSNVLEVIGPLEIYDI